MSKMEDTAEDRRHHYTDCGLDNVWIVGGFDYIESPYGQGVAIHDLDGLHKCIAQYLIEKHGPLTGKEFRFLRTELDLSQYTLGGLCGRKERMVREWETRSEPVEEPANTIIRFIYKQTITPDANYVEWAEKMKRLQTLDKECHELALRSTAEGWKAVEEKQAA